MISDVHSHVLPEIDDGSQSLRESIEMLKIQAAQGIQDVIATPHFYAWQDRPEKFLRKRREAEERLRDEMEKHPGLPRIHMGAEVHYFHGMSQSDAILELTISGKSCILIELEEEPWQESVFRELESLSRDRGLTPIIAHVERCIFPFSTNQHIRRLEELPVLVQSNASFFLNPRTSRRALRMLRKHQIHVIGSDCHNLTHRPPRLGEAEKLIRRELGMDALKWIASNEKAIFNS